MAIKAAETARPMWRRTPAPKRGEILYAFGALMAQHKERLARAMTREMGKVLAEARGDVQEGIDIAFLMAGEGRRMFGDTVPSELPDKWAMSDPPADRHRRDHHALELPDGDPVLEDRCRRWSPATPWSSSRPATRRIARRSLVELMAEAGFPPGVVNLVTGTRRARSATRSSRARTSP